MTDRLDQLYAWMDAPESQHLEFKEAKNTFNFDKLLNYCVALANERGGKLVLGVSNQRPRRVVGSLAFPDPAQTAAGLLTRLHFRVDAEEIAHPDGRVLVFHIPSRPIGVPVQINGVYWMRSGEELVAMTPDQLKRIMEEAEPISLQRSAPEQRLPTSIPPPLSCSANAGSANPATKPCAPSRPHNCSPMPICLSPIRLPTSR